MLEKILKLYIMATQGEVFTPMPHLFGPPGAGKSTIVQQAADLLDVKLHTINVSRISPLELEGVQMPVEGNTKLELLTATFWTKLQDGDILLLDEFLRGFPEVYNGLLDILTSREVGGFQLPNVFIIGASNSTVAYDKALEDRLLHLPMPDPRKSKKAKEFLMQLFVTELGLHPHVQDSAELRYLIEAEVLPTFKVMDYLGKRNALSASAVEGTSLRNLIGQAKLREIHSSSLSEVIDTNNSWALRQGKPQFMLLVPGHQYVSEYANQVSKLEAAAEAGRLNKIQLNNFRLNQQILQLEQFKKESAQLKVEEEETFHE